MPRSNRGRYLSCFSATTRRFQYATVNIPWQLVRRAASRARPRARTNMMDRLEIRTITKTHPLQLVVEEDSSSQSGVVLGESSFVLGIFLNNPLHAWFSNLLLLSHGCKHGACVFNEFFLATTHMPVLANVLICIEVTAADQPEHLVRIVWAYSGMACDTSHRFE